MPNKFSVDLSHICVLFLVKLLSVILNLTKYSLSTSSIQWTWKTQTKTTFW